ncbi:protein-L-isoaspartate O-methyltransferase domain-containing protein 1-like [Cimex lectularius]|uniref:Protein-L-isoaspartate O-methyltransferase domain-containing protein 1 n=1 Tax=Cimex lectularius TaxID=79782 RepID=A0A8I6R799_CIMLE|nr:protein-L-isoaspartate O-methyltransferase domain-containing protein 1-like [Cimex lectularius]
MGSAVSAGHDHDDLIDKLKKADYITTPIVESAFRAVDRGFYFLPECIQNAYKDLAWKNGNIHLSAPCIYGKVLESLKLAPGLSFLNLGSGTGYFSTVAGLILGPYGVNHGIELHADVTEYAYNKLSQFKSTSPALDCFEFCDPQFITGNSLCISSGSRQYDRVYCGAACPENHENYMKNLLKIGGILVMPINEQLVQITRKSETEWNVTHVLPVSFSILQTPDPNDTTTINLPELHTLSLQEICRASIRAKLRNEAKEEFPNILIRKRKYYAQKRQKVVPNLIIPILQSSDEEEEEERSILLPGSYRSISSVMDIASTMSRRCYRIVSPDLDVFHQNVDHNHDSDEVEEVGESSLAERRSKIPKREKQDSGVVPDIDNAQVHKAFSPESTSSSSIDEEDEEVKTGKPYRNKIVASDDTATAENGEDDKEEERMDVDSDCDCASSQSSNKENEKEIEEDGDVPLYSVIMKEKIQALPLPPALKSFLNYHRPF